MEVDFDKLIAANNLCQKWADHFGTKANAYHIFIADLRKNPQTYLNQLSKVKKKELQKDLSGMFYAAEVENDLIIQYRPTIFYVLNRYRVKNYDFKEDLYDFGLLTMRYSIWRYRKYDCTFKTFVINGLLQSFKGHITNRKKAIESESKNFFRSMYRIDLFSRSDKNNVHPQSKQETPENYLIRKENEITFDNLVIMANLTDEEKNLLVFYMEKNNIPENFKWRDNYNATYKIKYGKSLTRSSISDRLNGIKKRLLAVVKEIKGEEFASQYSKVG